MRIVQLTPGAGRMYCGCCLRDHALVSALRRRGHDALLVPLYLPLRTDAPDTGGDAPIFFGGINVYLQQKSALFRKLPAAVERGLNAPGLLNWAAGRAAKTSARDLGALTLSMLRGEGGRQVKELDKLIAWLGAGARPDVVVLSNALLAGLARRLQAALGAPVLCTLHGEDAFLDGLPEPFREACWSTLRERAAGLDGFVAVSRYYADLMGRRLGLPPERLHVVYNGVAWEEFHPAPAPPQPPVLGYFARLCRVKGLDALVEAFVRLKERGRVPGLRLRAAGTATPEDKAFLGKIRATLRKHRLTNDAEILPNLEAKKKSDFYRSLSVLAVPAVYGEAFGLYVPEAWASGVPVVQPRSGAFPELLAATGGGLLYNPEDTEALTEALESLLRDPEEARKLGEAGRKGVRERFGLEQMAERVLKLYTSVAAQPRPLQPAGQAAAKGGA